MRRRNVIGALAACALLPALMGSIAGSTAGPGSPDASFGTGGKTTLDFGAATVDDAFGVAVRPNGKVVVAGTTRTKPADRPDIAVAQFNRDGTPDSSFGIKGHTLADVGGDDEGFAVVLQPNGKIVVAGNTAKQTTRDFAVVRINPNGLFDTAFGVGGKAIVDFGGFDTATAVALRPNGKIVLAGYTVGKNQLDFAAAQLNANGTADTSFGVAGHTVADVPASDEQGNAVAVQPDGKIVVAGFTHVPGSATSDIAIVRINPNGLYDTAFGAGGKAIIDFGGSEAAQAMALQPDGKIVVAGFTSKGVRDQDFLVARISANGTVDRSFGGNGKATLDVRDRDLAWGLALQPDGKIVVGGGTEQGAATNEDFLVARFNPNGTIDRSFGAGGKTTVDFATYDGARALAVGPNGRIVTAGYVSNGATHRDDFAVVRLLGGPNATGRALSAQIVAATVVGQGAARTLRVRLRVSKAASATLRLRQQGIEKLKKAYSVKAGANQLNAALPSTLQKGTYKLEITLRTATGQRTVVKKDVAVPA